MVKFDAINFSGLPPSPKYAPSSRIQLLRICKKIIGRCFVDRNTISIFLKKKGVNVPTEETVLLKNYQQFDKRENVKIVKQL